MLDRCQQLAVGDLVAGEFVGDDHPRHVLQVFEQRAEESFGGRRISAGLDQNVEHVAVLVDRAPQVVLRAVDPVPTSTNANHKAHVLDVDAALRKVLGPRRYVPHHRAMRRRADTDV